jgi:uncharacterized protein YqeY
MRTDMTTVDTWKQLLRDALKAALRARQPDVVAVLRETLAAFDNAEAADLSSAPPVQDGVIAGGVAGLGAGEVQRRTLSAAEATAIVEREIEERRDAAATYTAAGRHDEATRLTQQADVLAALLTATPDGSGDPSP